MDWEFIVAVILAIPIILLPVALIWYLNLGGVISAVKGFRKRKAARHKQTAADVKTQDNITTIEF